jgi:hypothetical protein
MKNLANLELPQPDELLSMRNLQLMLYLSVKTEYLNS